MSQFKTIDDYCTCSAVTKGICPLHGSGSTTGGTRDTVWPLSEMPEGERDTSLDPRRITDKYAEMEEAAPVKRSELQRRELEELKRLRFHNPERIKKLLDSLAKAHPYLVKHAPHLDGEFDNALSEIRRWLSSTTGDKL